MGLAKFSISGPRRAHPLRSQSNSPCGCGWAVLVNIGVGDLEHVLHFYLIFPNFPNEKSFQRNQSVPSSYIPIIHATHSLLLLHPLTLLKGIGIFEISNPSRFCSSLFGPSILNFSNSLELGGSLGGNLDESTIRCSPPSFHPQGALLGEPK